MVTLRLFLCLALLLPAATSRADDLEGSPAWVEKTLASGDSATVVALGAKYLKGEGVPQDGKKAIGLFASAVAVGDARAECYLGIAFADGTGVPKNGPKAMDWFRAAARDGNSAAFDYLGRGYEAGLEGSRDLAKAFQYYHHSAVLGEPSAQWHVSVALQEGIGTKKDLVEALKWLQIADESGIRSATARRDEIETQLLPDQRQEARRRVHSFQPETNYAAFLDESKPVTVPLGNYFQIPVKIFGDTKNLVLDTGSFYTILEEDVKPRLPLLSPESGFEQRDCPEILIAGRWFTPLLALASNLTEIQRATGKPISGFLAMSCLKNEVVCFDSDNGSATIGGSVPESLKKNALAVPLTRVNNSTYGISAFINGHGPIFLAIDSGDASSITLNDPDLQTVFGNQPQNSRRTPFATADGQIFEEKSFRLRTLTIGTNTCANLIANRARNPLSYSRFGQRFISRYLCAADFPHRMLYLAPGKRFAIPDEYDMSGLFLLDTGGKITVYSVAEDSPAFAAGIRAHDQILSLNGRDTAVLNLKSIRDTLKANPSDEIKLQVKHDAQTNTVSFVLKRLL